MLPISAGMLYTTTVQLIPIRDRFSYNLANFYQKWFASPIHFQIPLREIRSLLFVADLVKAACVWLASFIGHGFVGMVRCELEIHRELSISDLNQSVVIWVHGGGGHKGPKLGHCLWISFFLLHFIFHRLSPPPNHTPTPMTTTCDIIH